MRFSRVFQESILDGLKSVLGECGVKAVLFDVELDRYVDDPGEFHRDLFAVFKDGAFSLERVVVKQLFQRLNLAYAEEGSFDFVRCVDRARKLFREREKLC